jgi:hypothetical protein
MDGLSSPAWVRSAIESGQCVFLSDRTRYSEIHLAHAFRNRGVIVGEASLEDRYLVACLAVADASMHPCEVCGEPSSLIRGPNAAVILYSGNDFEEALAAYEDWFK